MPGHSCGNPLHDVPQWAVFALPFLAPALVWARTTYYRLFPRKT